LFSENWTSDLNGLNKNINQIYLDKFKGATLENVGWYKNQLNEARFNTGIGF
jgi:hypothetical protein